MELTHATTEALQFLREGNAAASSNNYPAAVEFYSKGLALLPTSTGLLLNRSIAYERLSQSQNAFIDLGQYLRLIKDEAEQSLLALKRFITLGVELNQVAVVLKCMQDLELQEQWRSTEFYDALIGIISMQTASLESCGAHYLQRATGSGMLSQSCFENALEVWRLNCLMQEEESPQKADHFSMNLIMQLAMEKKAPQYILHAYLDLLSKSISDQSLLIEQFIGVLSLWIRSHPMDVLATEQLIQFLFDRNQIDLVEPLFLELSKAHPKEPGYLLGLAKARFFKRDLERAFVLINAALELDEKSVEIRLERARIFQHLLSPHLALVDLNQNLRFDENHIPSLIAKIDALTDLGRLDEALELHHGLAKRELAEEQRFNLELSKSILYRLTGRIDEWMVQADYLIEHFPNREEALCEKGWKEIYLGNWQEGFELYEHRFTPGMHYFPAQPHLEFAKIPKWSREVFQSSVQGKHLLLTGEEGMGDVIQFSRFIPLLLDRGVKITFMCKEAMHDLFAYNFPGVRLISSSTLIQELHDPKREHYDFYGEIMNIPWLLNLSVKDLSGAPYLKAIPGYVEKMAAYKQSLSTHSDHDLSIGLRWVTNLDRAGRSVPLENFKSISQLPISIFGLHYGPIKDADRELYDQWPNFHATELEVSDLAGLMMNLDCIVTSDTMTAHLAGALGRPTIVLIPVYINWRWGNTGDRSIWYDSMTVLRQDKVQDWSSVASQLVPELSRKINLELC